MKILQINRIKPKCEFLLPAVKLSKIEAIASLFLYSLLFYRSFSSGKF